MSDSESGFESEPYAFEGESPDRQRETESEELSGDTVEDGDSDIEIVGERVHSVLTHGIGKVLMTSQPQPLAVVYRDGSHIGLSPPSEPQVEEFQVLDRQVSYRSEASPSCRPEPSTSEREGAATGSSSQLKVTIVNRGRPRVPMGVPKEDLFGVDYLDPNKVTKQEIARIRCEYGIPDSVGMRIPGPTESLSKPKDGEVAFFTPVLQHGVRLSLQSAFQRILAQIGYAPGQYNPNFWVALMGVITAFGLGEEGEPSNEQFSYLYSITKSKKTDHGGWVQANCLKASERGHFISYVPTSQKTWRNWRVLLSGDWESPSGTPVRFHIPKTFQLTGRLSPYRSVG